LAHLVLGIFTGKGQAPNGGQAQEHETGDLEPENPEYAATGASSYSQTVPAGVEPAALLCSLTGYASGNACHNAKLPGG